MKNKPIRVQRKQTKGFKTPQNTMYVGRPSKYGNPFLVSELGEKEAVFRYKECLLSNIMVFYWIDQPLASVEYLRFKWMSENISNLKGKNLSCFCSLKCECHADVLIKFANKK